MIAQERRQEALLALLVALFGLLLVRYSGPILIPIFLAAFLTMMIQPPLRWLNRYLPRGLSITIVLIALSILLFFASILFLSSLYAITAKVPGYSQRFQQMLGGVLKYSRDHGVYITWKQLGTQQGISWLIRFFTSGLSSMLYLIGQTTVVLFITVFIVLETGQFERKIKTGFDPDTSDKILATGAAITQQLQDYMAAKTLVSLLTGFFTTLITYFLGVDFFYFWGILAFLLNYIPNIGSIIAILPPIAVAFLQYKSPATGIITMFGLAGIQTLIGNLIDPRIVGNSIRISPLVVFISMLFWGWMWGIIGMILAVPLTASIKVICKNIDSLRPIAILLGGDPTRKNLPPAKKLRPPPPEQTDDTEAKASTEDAAKTDKTEEAGSPGPSDETDTRPPSNDEKPDG